MNRVVGGAGRWRTGDELLREAVAMAAAEEGVPEDRVRVGAVIRALRKLTCVSQDWLAARLGVSGAAISHVEAGRRLPTRTFVAELCRLLGADPQLLLKLPGLSRRVVYALSRCRPNLWPDPNASAAARPGADHAPATAPDHGPEPSRPAAITSPPAPGFGSATLRRL